MKEVALNKTVLGMNMKKFNFKHDFVGTFIITLSSFKKKMVAESEQTY